MQSRRRLPRVLLNVLLYAPLAGQTARYLGEQVFYGEYLHWTGVWSTRILLLVLAVTPLVQVFRRASWTRWLLLRRRDFGVAAFIYALAHTASYLLRKADLALIINEAASAGMLTAWAALVVMAVLAATSNDVSVRRLGSRWKSLHRSVYLLAILTFAHWLLTAFDPTWGWVHLGIWIAFVGLRLATRLTRRIAT